MMDRQERGTERWDMYRNGRLWQRFESQDLATAAKLGALKKYPRDNINIVHILVR